MEPGETPADCALRETEEELAIPPAEIRLLGEGDFICSQRGFLLRPLPGLVLPRRVCRPASGPRRRWPTYTPCRWNFFAVRRRSAILTICCPMCRIISPMKPWAPRDYPWAAGRVEVPVWVWRGRVIWGMTARIVADLIARL